MAAALSVEETRKYGWTIKPRPAQPIERTIPPDESGRAAVAYKRVVLDLQRGGVVHCPIYVDAHFWPGTATGIGRVTIP